MTIAIILIALLIALLIFAATRPDSITIRRALEIKAPPERIYAVIEDFHHWPSWAPQDRMDPTMQRSYGGPEKGPGAFSEWTSSGHAGSGRMAITDAAAPSRITVTVDFVKPFKAQNINEFILEARTGATRLTWSMQGSQPFMAKVMGIFLDMDRMLGRHFEAGLQALRALAES